MNTKLYQMFKFFLRLVKVLQNVTESQQFSDVHKKSGLLQNFS